MTSFTTLSITIITHHSALMPLAIMTKRYWVPLCWELFVLSAAFFIVMLNVNYAECDNVWIHKIMVKCQSLVSSQKRLALSDKRLWCFVSQGHEKFSLNWYEPVIMLHFLCVAIYEMLQVWACVEFPALKGGDNCWLGSVLVYMTCK
jgi:hypothetical protein